MSSDVPRTLLRCPCAGLLLSRLIATPHPFKAERSDSTLPEGMTMAEMIEASGIVPILAAHGHVFVGDQYVQRHFWHRVRPKPGVVLTLRVVPHGDRKSTRLNSSH